MIIPWKVVLLDWVVLYAFIYWPTYVIGLVLILLAISILPTRKGGEKENGTA